MQTNDGKKLNKHLKAVQIAQEYFNANTKTILKKVVSGANHTLALTNCGKVIGWGDPESLKIGRATKTRQKEEDALKIEKIAAKNAIDIFCGNHHSFYINNKKQVFAWGLNNWGQLGIGSRLNTAIPVRVRELDPYEEDYVVQIEGGEHHSIALTKDGVVYTWGLNDEGQLGLGDTKGAYLKEKRLKEEQERLKKEEEDRLNAEKEAQKQQDIIATGATGAQGENKDEKNHEGPNGVVPEGTSGGEPQQISNNDPENSNVTQEVQNNGNKAKKAVKKVPKKKEAPKPDEMKYVEYFYRP